MDWVLDPVDDVELVRDIERVRSVGTEKEKDRIKFHKMSRSPFWVTLALFKTKFSVNTFVRCKLQKTFLSYFLHQYITSMNHLFSWPSLHV